jgi:hypothetical protein
LYLWRFACGREGWILCVGPQVDFEDCDYLTDVAVISLANHCVSGGLSMRFRKALSNGTAGPGRMCCCCKVAARSGATSETA